MLLFSIIRGGVLTSPFIMNWLFYIEFSFVRE